MKEKILDKQVLRYVIATTVSGKPTYLKKKLQKIEYSFVTDIDEKKVIYILKKLSLFIKNVIETLR